MTRKALLHISSMRLESLKIHVSLRLNNISQTAVIFFFVRFRHPEVICKYPGNSLTPAHAGRALILRSLLRNNDVHVIPRQLAVTWLIERTDIPRKNLQKENIKTSRSQFLITFAKINGPRLPVFPLPAQRKYG